MEKRSRFGDFIRRIFRKKSKPVNITFEMNNPIEGETIEEMIERARKRELWERTNLPYGR
jgi:predicted CopG family antitoxin